jgi:hypothetical protein
MSIQVVCPNGHPLKVQDSAAGKLGLCPVCKARVKVPQPDTRQVSEDTILDFLGPHKHEPAPGEGMAPADALTLPFNEGEPVPSNRCRRCNREMAPSIHVCPYCHTYIAGISET